MWFRVGLYCSKSLDHEHWQLAVYSFYQMVSWNFLNFTDVALWQFAVFLFFPFFPFFKEAIFYLLPILSTFIYCVFSFLCMCNICRSYKAHVKRNCLLQKILVVIRCLKHLVGVQLFVLFVCIAG